MADVTGRIIVGSVEYRDFPIEAEEDPTLFDVEVALVASGAIPEEDDFRDATWKTGGGPEVWEARILLGHAASDTDYAAGAYDAFVRITAGPEIPILAAGGITFVGASAPQIIDVDDLADSLEQDIDPDSSAAALACELASDVVRAKLRQTITLVEDDELRIEGACDDRVRLPERPVIEVASVMVDGLLFPSSGYNVIGDELVLVQDSGTFASIASGLGYLAGRGSTLDIVYSHGYAAVPPAIKGLALGIAKRLFLNPNGATAEGVLSYSVSFGDPADFPLMPFEDDVVSLYRRTVGTMTTR